MPDEFIKYVAEKKTYDTALEAYNNWQSVYERYESLLESKSADATALVDAFVSALAATTVCWH